jgi:hypothetical protein
LEGEAESARRDLVVSAVATPAEPLAPLSAVRGERVRVRDFIELRLNHFAGLECFGHPCQKHPSTNTATRSFGKTKSTHTVVAALL